MRVPSGKKYSCCVIRKILSKHAHLQPTGIVSNLLSTGSGTPESAAFDPIFYLLFSLRDVGCVGAVVCHPPGGGTTGHDPTVHTAVIVVHIVEPGVDHTGPTLKDQPFGDGSGFGSARQLGERQQALFVHLREPLLSEVHRFPAQTQESFNPLLGASDVEFFPVIRTVCTIPIISYVGELLKMSQITCKLSSVRFSAPDVRPNLGKTWWK